MAFSPRLKDAFLCIPIGGQAPLLFTFQWQCLDTKAMLQHYGTVLPQGLRDYIQGSIRKGLKEYSIEIRSSSSIHK